MKVNQLKIGNYVYCETISELVQVNTLSRIEKINSFLVNDSYYPHMILEAVDPIPLTEEWLLKFGFKKKIKGHMIKSVWFCSACQQKEWCFGELYQGTYVNIKHVHQLQNLYFALTNTELTLKYEVCTFEEDNRENDMLLPPNQ